ncbi:hypothetical protein BDW71DRAFT_200825 [Aspergillus fruticulosus]
MSIILAPTSFPSVLSTRLKSSPPCHCELKMSSTGGGFASGAFGGPWGFDPAVLTWERIPERGEACIGIAVNDEDDSLSAPFSGELRAVFTCPFMVWVKPNPGEEHSFVPCTIEDLEHIKTWTLVRKPGDQAMGWWVKGNKYYKGAGVVENVGVDVHMLAVQPFPRHDKRHMDRWKPGTLHRLLIAAMERLNKTDDRSSKMLAEARAALANVEAEQTRLMEERLALVEETVEAHSKSPGRNTRRPTSFLEDMIRKQGPNTP